MLAVNILYSTETSDKGHSERGQTSQERTSRQYSCIHTLYYRKSLLIEDSLSTCTKDKTAGPKSVLIVRGTTVIGLINRKDYMFSLKIRS